jgi:hypothetical protein
LLLKTFNDRLHQRDTGFYLFKYRIGYVYWPIRSCLKNDHYLVLQVKKFRQVCPTFGQLKLWANSLNGQIGKTVNVKSCTVGNFGWRSERMLMIFWHSLHSMVSENIQNVEKLMTHTDIWTLITRAHLASDQMI